MTCSHCVAAQDFFGEGTARRDLKRYHRRGPLRTTRMLLDAIPEPAARGATLLDIGGGVGAIQHELLDRGAARVVNVDASPAYQEAVRGEAARRGRGEAITFLAGDFVELAPEVPSAEIVTLDRVICCYPDAAALVDASVARARRYWGAVFPRERWTMRFWLGVVNLFQRLRRSAFRVYLHPPEGIVERVRAHGLREKARDRSFLWEVRLFERPEDRG